MSSAKRNDRIVDLRQKRPADRESAQAPLPLRPQKRVSPVRARRRRTRTIIASVILVLLIAGALALSYISYLPRYAVSSLTIQGAQNVSPQLVEDYAESIIYNGSRSFLSRANVLLYPKALIERDIPLEFPRIQSATISSPSLLSTAITIHVVERQTYALWCELAQGGTPSHCFDMDQGGYIFSKAVQGADPTGEYVFSGGVSTSTPPIGQTFAPGHTAGLVAFLQLLNQSGYTPLGATVESDQDFIVPLQQGYSVYASFGEDPGALVSNLQLTLSSSAVSGQTQDLEYVDLRFGDRVYYKLKGQDQGEASTTPQ